MSLSHSHLLLLSGTSSCHSLQLFLTDFILSFDMLRNSWLLVIYLWFCFPAYTPPKIISLPLAWEISIASISIFILIAEFFHYMFPSQTFSFRSLSFTVHSFLLSWPPLCSPSPLILRTLPSWGPSLTWIVPFNHDSSSLWYTSSFLKGWQTAVLFRVCNSGLEQWGSI